MEHRRLNTVNIRRRYKTEIQQAKIRIETLVPLRNYNIEENVPDTHKYTLNYRTDVFENEDIEKVKGIILDSYNQIKQLI